MSNVILDGNLSLGHGCFPPARVFASSTRTIINDKKIALEGDSYSVHRCPPPAPPPPPHSGNGISLAERTIIEDKKPLRRGDPISCGDTCWFGSPNTFIE